VAQFFLTHSVYVKLLYGGSINVTVDCVMLW